MKLAALSGGFGMIANTEYSQYKRWPRSHRDAPEENNGRVATSEFARSAGGTAFRREIYVAALKHVRKKRRPGKR